MSHWPKPFLEGKASSFCVLSEGGRVLFQNRSCRNLCGDYRWEECPRTCVSTCEGAEGKTPHGDGIRFFPNAKIGNQRFDAVFVDNGPSRMVILHPLRERQERLKDRFEARGLSPREMEVVRLGLEGWTNERIRKELGISAATLKTHLNNIYKKSPESRRENWRGRS
jgi:DNA-binding CsgD family transcriptional regulator